MRKRFHFYLMRNCWILLFALTVPDLARADIYMVCRQGGCIAPSKSCEVRMESEVVKGKIVHRPGGGYQIEATFVLKNTSATKVINLVAFPVLELPTFLLKQVDRDFSVEVGRIVGGKPSFVAVSFRSDLLAIEPSGSEVAKMMLTPPRKLAKYPKNIVWEMEWSPGETELVRIRYTTEVVPAAFNSTFCTNEEVLTYVVSTGSLWKGKIGRADFCFDFSPLETNEDGVPLPRSTPFRLNPNLKMVTSYPADAKWTTDSKVEWHFRDWSPSDEIFVRFIEWRDVPPYDEKSPRFYFYGLPNTYVGGRERYSERCLDELVGKETILAREFYPERLTATQLWRLKLWIAEWLMHEIFARNGQSFDQQMWTLAFMGYAMHGGWYRLTGRMDESQFSAVERANLSFLRSEIERIKAAPPSGVE